MALFVKIGMHLIGKLAQTLLSRRTRGSCRENNWLVLMLASFAQNSRTLYFSGSASMRVINHRGAQSPRLVGQRIHGCGRPYILCCYRTSFGITTSEFLCAFCGLFHAVELVLHVFAYRTTRNRHHLPKPILRLGGG
jgi:hypothetical protein